MTSRERFVQTMQYGKADRVPYFEEGIREEVIEAWRKQGLPGNADIAGMFPSDGREEIMLDLDPRPQLARWPKSVSRLGTLRKRLDPSDPARLPEDWTGQVRSWRARDSVLMLRVHRGFFLSLGVNDWNRFNEVIHLLVKDPAFVREVMAIRGRFSAELAEKVLKDVQIDAAVFSEPIGGNDRPLISPSMYEDLVLNSYEPVFDVLKRHGVETVIFRTFANARLLIPSVLRSGFNCLWACEVNIEEMDYRDLRKEFGPALRLIGGIDLDALRRGKEAIRKEVEEKVPPLLEGGGYVPMADGRIREDVPFENYVYYREILEKVTQG